MVTVGAMPENPEPSAEPAAAPEGAESPEAGNGEAKPAPPPAAKPKPPAAAAAKAPRELPSQEQIAAWVEGADLPSLSNLFNLLNTKLFDATIMQIRKEELLPQHWQVISSLRVPEDEEFERLAEVGRLRLRYKDREVSRRRLENLKVAWRELRGRRPSLWTVPDLFAAMRRIIDKKLAVDFHELLSATRDVWRDLSLPQGEEQIEILWACLALIRKKTKK